MFQMFNNIPAVTKNLLILNVLFYFVGLVLVQNTPEIYNMIDGHYISSPLFKPVQIITHFFMHDPSSIFHIFFNMMMLVIFGSQLERVWGPKRFFIFYIASALGSFTLFNGIGVYQMMELKKEIINLGYNIDTINNLTIQRNINGLQNLIFNHVSTNYDLEIQSQLIFEYAGKALSTSKGASGAIFGLMAAFAYLFPNTEMQLLFPPIPVKAKYLIGIYFVLELYLSFQNIVGDNVGHLAHVGGAIVGFILVFIWNKKKDRFY